MIGCMGSGNAATGRLLNIQVRAVVMSAARFVASSCLSFKMASTGGGKYLRASSRQDRGMRARLNSQPISPPHHFAG